MSLVWTVPPHLTTFSHSLQEGDQPGSPPRRGRSPSPRGGRGRSGSPRGGRAGGRSRSPPRRRTPSPRCVPRLVFNFAAFLTAFVVEAPAVLAPVLPGIKSSCGSSCSQSYLNLRVAFNKCSHPSGSGGFSLAQFCRDASRFHALKHLLRTCSHKQHLIHNVLHGKICGATHHMKSSR